MDLRVETSAIHDGTRRELVLSDIAGSDDLRIAFELVDDHKAPTPEVLDGFVSGVIFSAMQIGQPLRVHGPMSRRYLIQLSLFQEAWASLRPERYRRVDVVPTEVRDVVREGPLRAITGFTGGVDSTYTLLRNTGGELGLGSIPIEAVLFVQFSNKTRKGSPDRLFHKAKPLLESRGIELKTLRSDVRETSGQVWIDAHAGILSACFFNYSDRYGMAALSATEPVRAMVMPWGSNPATDPLLSSPAMALFHDGSAATRTEKLAAIASDANARRSLQVCLKKTDHNCGTCRKCVRTRLNFLAVGIPEPECFDGALDLAQIDDAEIAGAVDLGELRGVLAYAADHGGAGDWVQRLQARVDRYEPPTGLQVRLQGWLKSTRKSVKAAARKLR
jgi:hypothetical protein